LRFRRTIKRFAFRWIHSGLDGCELAVLAPALGGVDPGERTVIAIGGDKHNWAGRALADAARASIPSMPAPRLMSTRITSVSVLRKRPNGVMRGVHLGRKGALRIAASCGILNPLGATRLAQPIYRSLTILLPVNLNNSIW
jgi:hypothetical protein